MKIARLSLLALACLALSARADLTIVQEVGGAGGLTATTIKIKGRKTRIDATPQVATIIDGNSGEILNVMQEEKKFIRISAAQAKAAAVMALGGDKKQPPQKPELKSTGKKQIIDGYDVEEYVYETPAFTASYWIAPKYPNAAAILQQLQVMTPDAWGVTAQGMPDYRNFPGLPVRSLVTIGGQQITTTLKSVKQDPLPDSDFAPPKDFQEMKIPGMDAILGGRETAPKATASPRR